MESDRKCRHNNYTVNSYSKRERIMKKLSRALDMMSDREFHLLVDDVEQALAEFIQKRCARAGCEQRTPAALRERVPGTFDEDDQPLTPS